MNYGLDSNLVSPPFSAFIALVLIAGCDALGVRVAKLFGLLGPFAPTWHRFQAPILGLMLLSVVLYPLALVGLTTREFLQFIAVSLSIYGVIHIFITFRVYSMHSVVSHKHVLRRLISLRGWNLLLAMLLIFMGLIALAPVTNADSLDYHIGVALAILNTGTFPFIPEWFHSRLSGNGEVLIALGLSIGSEQFGSIMQFSGLIGVVGLFISGEVGHRNSDARVSHQPILAVAAASPPVLLFLVSSTKPQFLLVAMTTLAFALIVFPSRRYLAPRASLLGFTLICFLVMTASQGKFSFLLGGGVVGSLGLAIMVRQGLFIPAIGIGVVVSLIVLTPPVLWKYFHFGGGLIDALIKPFPGNWYGYDDFVAVIREYRDSPVPFPLSLIIPYGIGSISTIIGAGLLLPLIRLRPGRDPWAWALVLAALFVTTIGATLGQSTSRFFLEPYYWLLMALLIGPVSLGGNLVFKWVRWSVVGQAWLSITLGFYGVVTLLPGAITVAWRDRVMSGYANGYSVMKWADFVLPSDAVLLSGHRSVALAPREVVPVDWANFVNPDTTQSIPYLLRLKARGISHMLVIGESAHSGPFKGCLGKIIAGPWNGLSATRNPFNVGGLYTAWIVEINRGSLPSCALSEAKP